MMKKKYFLARHYEYLFIIPITLDMEVWLSENRDKYFDREEAQLIENCLWQFDFEGKELYDCDNNYQFNWMLNPEFDTGEYQYNIMVPYNCWEIINEETYNIEFSEIWEDFLKDSLE